MRKKELTTTTILAGEPYLPPYRNTRPVRLLETDRVWTPTHRPDNCFKPTQGQQQSRSSYYSGRDIGRICITLPHKPTTPYTEGELNLLRDVKVPAFHHDPDRAAEELANFRDLHGDLHVALVNTSRIRATWEDHVAARRAEEEETDQAMAAARREEAFARSVWQPVRQVLDGLFLTDYRTASRAEDFRDPSAVHFHDEEAVTAVTLTVPQLVDLMLGLLLSEKPVNEQTEGLHQARVALNERAREGGQ